MGGDAFLLHRPLEVEAARLTRAEGGGGRACCEWVGDETPSPDRTAPAGAVCPPPTHTDTQTQTQTHTHTHTKTHTRTQERAASLRQPGRGLGGCFGGGLPCSPTNQHQDQGPRIKGRGSRRRIKTV